MEGVLDRLAEQVGISGWEIRDAQRDHARARCGARARSWTTAASAPRRCLDAVKPALRRRPRRGQGRRRRPRPEELGPGQRLQGDRQGGRPLPRRRHRRGAPLLDRDGPGRAHRRRCRSRSEELGIDPARIRVDRRHDPRARRRPDHRARAARSWARARWPTRAARPWPTGAAPTSTTRASTASTGRTQLSDGLEQPDHPLDVRLRRAARDRRPRDRARSSRWSPPTTSAGR